MAANARARTGPRGSPDTANTPPCRSQPPAPRARRKRERRTRKPSVQACTGAAHACTPAGGAALTCPETPVVRAALDNVDDADTRARPALTHAEQAPHSTNQPHARHAVDAVPVHAAQRRGRGAAGALARCCAPRVCRMRVRLHEGDHADGAEGGRRPRRRRAQRPGARKVLVQEFAGNVYAVSNKCSHLGLPLQGKILTAKVADGCVVCPAHNTAFDLATGAVKGEWCPSMPNLPIVGKMGDAKPLPVFKVKVEANGDILVAP